MQNYAMHNYNVAHEADELLLDRGMGQIKTEHSLRESQHHVEQLTIELNSQEHENKLLQDQIDSLKCELEAKTEAHLIETKGELDAGRSENTVAVDNALNVHEANLGHGRVQVQL